MSNAPLRSQLVGFQAVASQPVVSHLVGSQLARQVSFAVIAAVCAGSLVGCGNDKDSPAASVGQALKDTNLQGSWLSQCTKATLLFGYEIKSIELKGNDVTMVTQGYTGSDCKPDTLAAEVKETGTFETGGSSQGGNNIQFTLQKASVRAKNDAGKALLNNVPPSGACGVNDWKVDEERDVTANTGEATCWSKTPRTLFDIYTIEGTTLFLGKGWASEKAGSDKRPRELDRRMPFAKR